MLRRETSTIRRRHGFRDGRFGLNRSMVLMGSSPRSKSNADIERNGIDLLRQPPKCRGLRHPRRRSRFAAMTASNKLAIVAACAGDPARASMLNVLVDGRAFTAGELSSVARHYAADRERTSGADGGCGPADGREPGAASLLSTGVAGSGDDARKHDGGRGIRAPDRPHRSGRRKPAARAHLLRSSRGPAGGRHCRHR